MKRCSVCKEEKPFSDFAKNSRAKDGKFAYCKPCSAAKHQAWKEANPEKYKAAQKKWREYQSANGAGYAEYSRQWKRANPEKVAESNRRQREKNRGRRFGLTPADLAEMLEKQGGVCAICCGPPTGGRDFAVDHCHTTGTIRGRLCSKCNPGIGLFDDDPARLRAAADYLERYR